ncbi:glycosyltransferase [Halovulum dunhuangense]|uniref:Glycosyltransferase n=1 Tax=Halovulum dunhuangense TaxID=1505036 RepID=A0A849KVG9_9RHOB|nr:glycosyltransferase [Halovulum dunhuangense]NNU79065.1 glycosyltransferase [Halovulum dunhuangense]
MAMTTGTSVMLAIATCRRPEGLARLLAAVAGFDVPPGVAFAVHVVDNSPEGSALTFLRQRAVTYPFPLTCGHEPRRGLSRARNAALRRALAADANLMGFIDDDEMPEQNWLSAHLATLSRSGADASLGPVTPRFDRTPPRWIARGGFLAMAGHPDGAPLRFGATSNILFRTAPVRTADLSFDPALDLTGGEDTAFFDAYLRTGARIVFCAAAGVEEDIPPSRASLPWLWRRWRRSGQTNARLMLGRHPVAGRPACLLGGALRLAAGSALLLALLPLGVTGHPGWARGLKIAARGAGFVDIAAGRSIHEYATLVR